MSEERTDETQGKDVEAHGPVKGSPAKGQPVKGISDQAPDELGSEPDVELHGPVKGAPVKGQPFKG